jgi:hypothetical protein
MPNPAGFGIGHATFDRFGPGWRNITVGGRLNGAQSYSVEKYCHRVDVLKQRRNTLQWDLDNIGMSRAMFHQQVDNYLPPPRGAHAIVARKEPMTGGHKPYSYWPAQILLLPIVALHARCMCNNH